MQTAQFLLQFLENDVYVVAGVGHRGEVAPVRIFDVLGTLIHVRVKLDGADPFVSCVFQRVVQERMPATLVEKNTRQMHRHWS